VDVERLPGPDEVLAAAGGDRFARNTIRPGVFPTVGWRCGPAVAWVGVDAEERRPYLQALGPPAEVAAVLEVAGRELPAGVRDGAGQVPLTVPAAAVDALGGRLRVDFHWLFRTSDAPPAPVAGVDITVLPPEGDARVRRLLDRSVDLASAWPGDPGVRRWVVVADGDDVVACAADTSGAAGIGHMGGVAVAPEARRRGLGAAVVSWLTRDLLLGGHDAVAIGVLVTEPAAQRLYDSLGYMTEHELMSGPLVADGT
jgi:ribosomal protein S18 acetylase RimI-like enzyme